MNNSVYEYLTESFGCREVGAGQLLIYNGECPFCGRSGNNKIYFSIDKMEEYTKPSGICFHCSKGFSALAFVAAYEGVSTPEAVRILNQLDSGYVRTNKEVEDVYAVEYPTTASLILPGTEAHTYLKNRGIDDKIIRDFDLKVCHDNFQDSNGNTVFTKNRVIFPIYNEDRKLVSWQGRDITGLAKNKYLFPKGFDKANYVFNCQNITDKDYLIICEGVMDVIGWYRNGFTNVVATFGKVMSKYQLGWMLNKDVSILYMAWDSDADNNKQKFMRDYKDHFKDIRHIELNGKDADECSKEELCNAISSASSFSWSSWVLGRL